MYGISATGTIEKIVERITRATNYSASRVRQNNWKVPQLCISTETEWHSPSLPGPYIKRPIHRGTAINSIFPKLINECYLTLIDVTLIDVSSGYHNLKCDRKSSFGTKYASQFGWYRFTRLQFGVVPVGVMFQLNIDEIFQELLNILALQMTF